LRRTVVRMLLTTSADLLARATYNALRCCPKTHPWDAAYVTLTPEGVTIITSNGYVLSWAICPAEMPRAVYGATIKISREDLERLEEKARKDKTNRIQLEFEPEEHLGYRGEKPDEYLNFPDIFQDSEECDEGTWDEINLETFRELIKERETDPNTRRVILATEYIRKIGQIKKEDKNIGADFCFAGPDDPVLIKVGDYYRMAIEPIDRERHKEALGEGVVW